MNTVILNIFERIDAMTIIFEDGRKIDSENPGSELIKRLEGKPQ